MLPVKPITSHHHNFLENLSTRAPGLYPIPLLYQYVFAGPTASALLFSFAHIFSNYYKDVFMQGIHTRSGAQALVEYNAFSNVTEAISTYGKVIPQDSPNTLPGDDYEPDGFVNEQCEYFINNQTNRTEQQSLAGESARMSLNNASIIESKFNSTCT
jgi:hypothetical protein